MKFIYTDEDINVTKKNAKDLLKISESFGIESLSQACKFQLIADLVKKNAQDAIKLDQLMDKALDLFPKKAIEVSTQTDEPAFMLNIADVKVLGDFKNQKNADKMVTDIVCPAEDTTSHHPGTEDCEFNNFGNDDNVDDNKCVDRCEEVLKDDSLSIEPNISATNTQTTVDAGTTHQEEKRQNLIDYQTQSVDIASENTLQKSFGNHKNMC